MSDVRDPDHDQPLPVHNANEYVQEMVITDLHARMQHGIRKYGTALQAGNGRDMLQDAYEEVLDLAVYLRGEIEERRAASRGWATDVLPPLHHDRPSDPGGTVGA